MKKGEIIAKLTILKYMTIFSFFIIATKLYEVLELVLIEEDRNMAKYGRLDK